MSAVALLEKLLDDQSVTSKEHVLDTASRHVSDVENRFIASYESLVNEITRTWGLPQFNSTMEDESQISQEEEEEEEPAEQQQTTGTGVPGERKRKKLRNVVPPWAKGIASSGGDIKAIRLCYWKRPTCIGYVVLRKEIDTKRGIALMYMIALGVRKRGPEKGRTVEKLRHSKEDHWLITPVKNFLGWLAGR